jgi:hypothetical protein
MRGRYIYTGARKKIIPINRYTEACPTHVILLDRCKFNIGISGLDCFELTDEQNSINSGSGLFLGLFGSSRGVRSLEWLASRHMYNMGLTIPMPAIPRGGILGRKRRAARNVGLSSLNGPAVASQRLKLKLICVE